MNSEKDKITQNNDNHIHNHYHCNCDSYFQILSELEEIKEALKKREKPILHEKIIYATIVFDYGLCKLMYKEKYMPEIDIYSLKKYA